MNEDEKNLFHELTQIRINFNERVIKIMTMTSIVYVLTVIILGSCLVIQSVSHDKAIQECTRLYFETDYDYGTITQTTDVKVRE